jgi:hypothetical protein
MDRLFQVINSPLFASTMFNLSNVTFVRCLCSVVVAMAFYRRGREEAVDEADSHWVLLFATWRDSLIVTLLYVAEGFAYSQSALISTSQIFPKSVLLYGPAIQPVISMSLQVLIFVICAIRIIALTKWLNQRT